MDVRDVGDAVPVEGLRETGDRDLDRRRGIVIVFPHRERGADERLH